MGSKVVLKCTDELFNLAVSISDYIRQQRKILIIQELIRLSNTKSWKYFWSYFEDLSDIEQAPYKYTRIISRDTLYNTIWKYYEPLDLCTLIITSMTLPQPLVSEIIVDEKTYNQFIKLYLEIAK